MAPTPDPAGPGTAVKPDGLTAGQGYQRTAAEMKTGVVPHSYEFPPGNVKRYGAVGDLKTNDTESISQALSIVEASGGVSVHFPPGNYLVDTLTFAHNGTYSFDNATLFAASNLPQKCLVKFTGAYSNIYNMSLNCRWKPNYECALWWTSDTASSPSQSNNFWGLTTQNTLMGVLYGTTSGGVNVPQSENYVYGFHSRGTSTVLHSNQPNGFIAFLGGQLTSSKNEWDVNNANIYDYASANVITNAQGVVRCVGCDLEKPESTLGYGFVQTGSNSVTELYDCDYEVACQMAKLSAGKFVIRGGGGYWNNGTASCVALFGSRGGQLNISGFTLNKDARHAAANTAFLDLGGTSNWNVTLSDLRLENQLNPIFYNGASTPNVWVGNRMVLRNVESVATGGAVSTPLFTRITSDTNNLLDLRGTDTVGNDASTWYHRGAAGSAVITLNTDTPADLGFANCIQAVMSGSAEAMSLDMTSLTSVKNTAIKCKAADQFMVSGWARVVAPGDAQISALFVTADGVTTELVTIADNSKIAMNSWVFINGLVTAPKRAAYMGVGMSAAATTVRMIGLKVSRLS